MTGLNLKSFAFAGLLAAGGIVGGQSLVPLPRLLQAALPAAVSPISFVTHPR